jgi:regulator of sirC expression with transglutaminase-like and TPR domain
MNPPSSIGGPPVLSEKQRSALVSLLADDDPGVYQTVRRKILAYGVEACQWLRPHTLSDDPVLRRRATEVLHYLLRQAADNEFLAFCLRQGEDCCLEEGCWLLARTEYPDISPAAYQAILDQTAAELRERLPPKAGVQETLAAINHQLFTVSGYAGNELNYYDPENSYLNRVIDRRLGNPISLCLIYLFVARRLQLPVAGIGLPGHFLCRYQSSTEEIYIDAFNKGKLLLRADCVKYLQQTSYGYQEQFLNPVSPRRILLRVCTNLHQIYQHTEKTRERERMQRYIVALTK